MVTNFVIQLLQEMKKVQLVTCLLLLLMFGLSLQQSASASIGDIWCNGLEAGTPDKCDAEANDICIKCHECLQGKINRGFRPSKKVTEEAKENGNQLNPNSLCISIWAWLAPVLAVIAMLIGLWVFCKCCRKPQSPAGGVAVAPSPRN